MIARRLKTILATVLLVMAGSLGAFAQQQPDFHKMLQRVDELNNFTTDFSAVFTIVSEKPGQDPTVTKAQIFRRDPKKQFLIVILRPETQTGQGYLQVNNNLWFYDPQSRQFSHSSLKENFQSSDAKNSDFNRRSLAKDYTIAGSTEGKLGSYPGSRRPRRIPRPCRSIPWRSSSPWDAGFVGSILLSRSRSSR